MFEGKNKRGQEGVTLTTLLLMVLGIVVIVVVIIGFTGGFNFIFDKFQVAPGQSLESVIQSCKIAAQAELSGDYCLTFKKVEINGVSQFATCNLGVIEDNIEEKFDGCKGNNEMGFVSKKYCTSGSVKGGDFKKTIVNGQTCAQWFELSLDSCTGPDTDNPAVIVSCSASQFDITASLKVKPADSNKCCLNKQLAPDS